MAIAIFDVAAREAYMAAFHAAQALLFERHGRVPRKHAGVHGAFAKLCTEEPGLDRAFGRFLADAYNLKQTADYAADRTIDADRARQAIDKAGILVAAVEAALAFQPVIG
jgi:uncharacterized protein (UPF0332 family)